MGDKMENGEDWIDKKSKIELLCYFWNNTNQSFRLIFYGVVILLGISLIMSTTALILSLNR